jgi:SH3-like domain-containing protein
MDLSARSALFMCAALFACVFFPERSRAQSFCVKNSAVKLYAQPDEKSKVLATAAMYTPLSATGNKRDHWVEVSDVNSQKSWVQKKHLSSKMSCLVIVVNRTRLRSGPGSEYALAKMKSAEKFATFKDLGGEDGWTEVEDKFGAKSWVDMDHVWKPKSRMRISFEGD